MRFSDLIKQPLIENINICRYIKDELPPLPGSIPIPAAHIRLFHQVLHNATPNNLDTISMYRINQICTQGIFGSTTEYEPEIKAVWALHSVVNPYEESNIHGFYNPIKDTITVEFSISTSDPNLKLRGVRGTPTNALYADEYKDKIYAISRDIRPNEILAIHMPWHAVARIILNHKFDNIKQRQDYAEQYLFLSLIHI